MRYSGGWIKSYKRMTETEIAKDPELISIFMWLLWTANFKESTVHWEGKPRQLLPGQNIISIREMSNNTGISQATFHRKLIYLESINFVKREVGRHGQIVTICNWKEDQENEDDCETQCGTQMKREWNANETRMKRQEERRTKERKKKEEELINISEVADAPVGTPEFFPSQVMIDEEKPKRIRKPKTALDKTDGSRVWEAYAEAYTLRYSKSPIRNAKMNKACCQIVERLGAEEAPYVAAYYVNHNGFYYVSRMHQLGLLVADAEKIHTEWALGRQMTTQIAKNIDSMSTNHNVIANYLRESEETHETHD